MCRLVPAKTKSEGRFTSSSSSSSRLWANVYDTNARSCSSQLISSRSFSSKPEGEKVNVDKVSPPDSVKSSNSEEKSKAQSVVHVDFDDQDDYYEEPKTAGQKVAFYTKLMLQLAMLGFGAVCVFYTARELFPGRLNPNSLFSETFEILRYNIEITNILGSDVKGYGRDSGGGSREGRRNHIDSFKYTSEDGSNRIRIRYNLKGKRGNIRVWVEVSDKMAASEYVYIICQNMKTGRVYTIEDNRELLDLEWKQLVDSGGGQSFLSGLDSIFKKDSSDNSKGSSGSGAGA